MPEARSRNSNEEKAMSIRFLTTSAAILLIAGPAFADCSQEIESLKAAVTEAETGASTAGTGMPATKHQEQVLAGDQQANKSSADAAAGQAGVPASPHQEQVLAEPAARGHAASGQQAADLVTQASDMAAAGDEQGCMQRVAEAKDLLGMD
jgi:hypothetical protein